MTETDWTAGAADPAQGGGGWLKYVIGGVLIMAAVALLLYTTTRGNSQYLLTINELQQRSTEMLDKDARISGIVVPDSITYDANTLHLEFDVVDESGASGTPLRIVMDGEPLPDQMKDEANAIAEGRLQSDGTFKAETLMMKCASKYEVEVEG